MKGMIYAHSFRDESIARFAHYMKTTPENVAAEYDQLRELMAPGSKIDPDVQTNEIALRGQMLGLPKAKLPPNSAVFDFSWADRVAEQLKTEGWTPTP